MAGVLIAAVLRGLQVLQLGRRDAGRRPRTARPRRSWASGWAGSPRSPGSSPACWPRSPALFLVGAPDARASPRRSYTVALRAFPAAILGGLDSTGGALVGGLLIGIAESLAAGYQDQLLFLGRGFGDVVPYVVMIAVLLVRPSGLFGTKELTRV